MVGFLFFRILVSVLVLASLLVVGLNLHVQNFSAGYIAEDPSLVRFADNEQIPVVMVLGASVMSDGSLSTILEDRTSTALDIYRRGLAKKILISGDNGTESYNEVVPIRAYFIRNGVPEEDIFVDFAGFDTYDSMYRAGYIFEAKNILVITQKFHLSRAVYVGRNLGLDVYGIPADKRRYLFNNNFREVFAVVKAFLEVSFESKPKFLGEKIPIAGDGRDAFKFE